jgi:mannose-6-phosphate isomerase-like protein (cupin superfamily)
MDIKKLQDLIAFNADKMQKVSVFSSSHLFYDLYCLEPGQAQKVHSHSGSDKIYLLLQGSALVTIGSEESTLSPNQAVLASAGIPHGVRNASRENAVLLVVTAPPPSSK